jgi:hypothetical protein
LLGDGTPDTGCGLKVFPKATFFALIFNFIIYPSLIEVS